MHASAASVAVATFPRLLFNSVSAPAHAAQLAHHLVLLRQLRVNLPDVLVQLAQQRHQRPDLRRQQPRQLETCQPQKEVARGPVETRKVVML